MTHKELLEMQKRLDDATNANDVLNELDALVKSIKQEENKQDITEVTQ